MFNKLRNVVDKSESGLVQLIKDKFSAH